MTSSGATLPGSDARESEEGRLSNVSGVVTAGPGDDDESVTALCELLERVCEDVVVQRTGRDDSPLATLVAALEVSQADRVLVLSASATATAAELVLALVAWPERPIVHPAGSWCVAIYLRESVLPAARERLAAGDADMVILTATVDVGELDGDDLSAVSPSAVDGAG